MQWLRDTEPTDQEIWENLWKRKVETKIFYKNGIIWRLESSFSNFTCFDCDSKIEWPNAQNKENGFDRKNEKSTKTRKAYIAWQDNDETSSSVSSKEDE